jgi:hypothetical protein
MLNLKRDIFAATERTFRFVGLNASFESMRTFRFADCKYNAPYYFLLMNQPLSL